MKIPGMESIDHSRAVKAYSRPAAGADQPLPSDVRPPPVLLVNQTVHRISVARSGPRPGDQRVFVVDTRKAERELGWEPKVGVEEGVRKLFEWVRENKELF